MNDKVLTEKHQSVTTVFNTIVTDVQKTVNTIRHQAAVDIELNFNQVAISEKGIPLFTKKKEETSMSIKLATRIIPTE